MNIVEIITGATNLFLILCLTFSIFVLRLAQKNINPFLNLIITYEGGNFGAKSAQTGGNLVKISAKFLRKAVSKFMLPNPSPRKNSKYILIEARLIKNEEGVEITPT